MRLALWSLAAIIAIGVAVVFVAPLFISAEDVRNRLFAEIEEATGYRLTVNGSLHISAFPTLKLVAEDVGVAQTKGAGAVDLATAKELRFGLAVAPLLSGKVQLTEVALISPILTMPEASPKTAGAEPSEKAGGGASIATALRSLSLDSLRIEDGTLVLRGEGGAPGKRIDGLNLEASLPAFDAPLSVDVKARFDGQPLGVTGSISSFGPFLDGEAAQLLLDVDAPAYLPAEARADGQRDLYRRRVGARWLERESRRNDAARRGLGRPLRRRPPDQGIAQRRQPQCRWLARRKCQGGRGPR